MLRWAVLGTGFISDTVADAIKQSDGSSLVAVCGRSSEKVTDFAKRHDVPKTYVDQSDLMADPDVDAVYIGLPNHVHLPATRAAAQAGKAVLSEKSLTTTYADAETLIESVQSSNTFFLEGLMYLSHPLYRKLASLLTDQRLGAIRTVHAVYAANIKDVVNPAGRGTLYNLGCYPASLLHFVIQQACGEDAFSNYRIKASGNLNSDGNICDAAASIHFENGILATLHSTDSYGMHHAFEIVGTDGSLRFYTNPWHPLAGDNLLEIREHGNPAERIIHSDTHNSFFYQIKVVEQCVAQGLTQAPRPSPRWRDSLEIMRLLTDWEAAARA